ncbi:MAG: response regulator [Chloroflexi bacterium]|nr:response regulator [Chloroflexota bacterium]
MTSNAGFWLILVYFIYGLAYFAMGLAVMLESRRDSTLALAQSLWLLALFGLLHSLVEWSDMLRLISGSGYLLPNDFWLRSIRFGLMPLSAFALAQFGANLVTAGMTRARFLRRLPLVLFILWFAGFLVAVSRGWVPTWLEVAKADAWARYLLYLPGSLLTAWGVWRKRYRFREMGLPSLARDCAWLAGIFVANAFFAGLIVPAQPFFPASLLNIATFTTTVGLPPQVFRAAAAVGIAYFVVRILRVFDYQRRLELERANARLTDLSAQVIAAQEEERKRVARELHDQTTQALTALLIRLRLAGRIRDQETLEQELTELRDLTANTLEEVHQLALGLRPTDLDDLGLVAALERQVTECQNRFPLQFHFQATGFHHRLLPPVELALYRVVQEALTNAVRHAKAQHVQVSLERQPQMVIASVCDDGQGFDVNAVREMPGEGFGLLGMEERVNLLSGVLQVQSAPGQGTTVTARVPLDEEEMEHRGLPQTTANSDLSRHGKIHVLLADDHPVLRFGLVALLNAEPDLVVVGEAENGQQAVSLAKELHPHVVVMDISMPGMNGLEATWQIKSLGLGCRVLILTVHAYQRYLFRVLEAGGSGYLLKNVADAELVKAIRAVARGEVYLHPDATRLLMQGYLARAQHGDDESSYNTLSEREREVLHMVAAGYTSQEIGEQLVISAKTVDTYRTRIMEKLNLHRRHELVRYALEAGLLTSEPTSE